MAIKREDYRVPQCQVSIGGTILKPDKLALESVKVQMTASDKANSCELLLLGSYDAESSKLKNSILDKVIVGKKVQVKMGYSSKETVFMGYVNSVNVEFGIDGIYVNVSCLDARGLLMGNTSWKSFKSESMSQIIHKILDPLTSYTSGVKVSIPGAADKENPLSQHDLDDYGYVCTLAKLTGSSFCMIGGELRFVKNIFKTASVQKTYKWGSDLLSFSRTDELSEQIGSVTVHGHSPDTIEEFSATVTPPTGKGKTGAQLSSGVKAKKRELTSSQVKSMKEAKAYAEALMFGTAMKLSIGSAAVLGNQKLKPGGKVKFDGLDPKLNGEYYIMGLVHQFDSQGFRTNISFCNNTV